eukprot:6277931-Alexandrium_andersonii.AAC.1
MHGATGGRKGGAGGATCNPQSARGPSVLQSASIRNPPFRKCALASGIRNLNCADPGTSCAV